MAKEIAKTNGGHASPFEQIKRTSFRQLLQGFKEYKGKI
jgi:hypothetical protein